MASVAVTTRCLRRGAGFEAEARSLLDLGFERLVLDPGLRQPDWEILAGFLSPRSVRAAFLFAPLPGPLIPGAPTPPRLASLDADERREAEKRCRRSVQFADRYRIATIVVPPGALEEPDLAEIRRVLGSRRSTAEAWEQLRRQRAASESRRRQLDALLGDLSALFEAADDYGVEVALIPAGLPDEIPDYRELEIIAREFAGAPMVLWADALRHARSVVAGVSGALEFCERSPAVRAVLVHDGNLVRGQLPLGAGQLELERWRAFGSDGNSEWILDFGETAAPDALLAARARLERLAAPPAATPDVPPFLDTSSRDLV